MNTKCQVEVLCRVLEELTGLTRLDLSNNPLCGRGLMQHI